MKTTIQILYDKGLFDNSPNADAVLKDFCLLQEVEVIYRKVNDVVQGCYSWIKIKKIKQHQI